MSLTLAAQTFFLAAASSQEEKRDLWIVARKTGLVHYTKDGPVVVKVLKPGELIITMRSDTAAVRQAVVVQPSATPPEGWVDTRGCHHFHPHSTGRRVPAPSDTPVDDYPPRLPALVRRAPAHIQQAYRELEATIQANKALKKEVPEPYFVRARLWGMVKDYDKALRDYSTGAKLVKANRLNPVEYSAYFDELQRILENLDGRPSPIDSREAEYHFSKGMTAYFTANHYFGQGSPGYLKGELKRALAYFDDAASLDAPNPLLWYFRALTHLRLGDEQSALHDARLGASLEAIDRRSGKSSEYIQLGLERVQGPMRQWLTKIRNGSHEAP